jgi:hypothetical protein
MRGATKSGVVSQLAELRCAELPEPQLIEPPTNTYRGKLMGFRHEDPSIPDQSPLCGSSINVATATSASQCSARS